MSKRTDPVVTARVAPELYARLDAYTALHQRRRSDVIEEALRLYLLSRAPPPAPNPFPLEDETPPEESP